MKRRTFLDLTAAAGGGIALGAGGLALGSAGVSLGSCSARGGGRQPDIVLIFVDDLGLSDLSCFGCTDYDTPHIDSIGERGARLTDFYTAAPVCTPSRYALLTGRYPFGSGVNLTTALMPADTHGLDPDTVTLPEVLQRAGYRTACVGKWHLGRLDPVYHPHRHGFEHFYGFRGGLVDYYRHAYAREHDWWRNDEELREEGYVTDLLTREAERLIAAGDDRPLFLYLSYSAPHYARDEENRIILQPRREDADRFPGIADEKRRAYAGMVAALDEGVGRVIRALETSGRAGNTLLLFVSDNGPELDWGGTCTPLRGAKRFLYEGGIRMPALVQWPGRVAAGVDLSWPGCTLDLFPTFAALAGVGVERGTRGTSGTGGTGGTGGTRGTDSGAGETRDAGRAGGAEAGTAIGDSDLDGTAIEDSDLDVTAIGDSNLDGTDISGVLRGGEGAERDLIWSYGGAAAIRAGHWKLVRRREVVELFDLETDISESRDLSSAEPDRVRDLAARLDAELARVEGRRG